MGQVDKYSWKDNGSSFGLADVLAAYLLAQLERPYRRVAVDIFGGDTAMTDGFADLRGDRALPRQARQPPAARGVPPLLIPRARRGRSKRLQVA